MLWLTVLAVELSLKPSNTLPLHFWQHRVSFDSTELSVDDGEKPSRSLVVLCLTLSPSLPCWHNELHCLLPWALFPLWSSLLRCLCYHMCCISVLFVLLNFKIPVTMCAAFIGGGVGVLMCYIKYLLPCVLFSVLYVMLEWLLLCILLHGSLWFVTLNCPQECYCLGICHFESFCDPVKRSLEQTCLSSSGLTHFLFGNRVCVYAEVCLCAFFCILVFSSWHVEILEAYS